ncbi:hypothetical protein AAHA92_29022 [Salvia divinorum]|uniref:Uncharacterized protein n=1 Tax=Salvia divinorum TaxID=28513 RepID=A0ABD1FWY9_SALDI
MSGPLWVAPVQPPPASGLVSSRVAAGHTMSSARGRLFRSRYDVTSYSGAARNRPPCPRSMLRAPQPIAPHRQSLRLLVKH